jgi:hypothetical protein
MDVELFNDGVRPKRAGSLNIYDAFASDKLDAFILLSSAATVLGSKGTGDDHHAEFRIAMFLLIPIQARHTITLGTRSRRASHFRS